MKLSYELAQRHYQIQRLLELEPSTQAYTAIAHILAPLPSHALIELYQHAPKSYRILIPMCLLLSHFEYVKLQELPEKLQQDFQVLYQDFSGPMIEEQERLLKDSKLYRYLYARSILMSEIDFHQNWHPKGSFKMDRDSFRQYLSAYISLVRGGLGNPYLEQLWHESGWLQRWQLTSDESRNPLPVAASPKVIIAKYKLPERAKILYKDLDQGVPAQERFLEDLPEALQNYFQGCDFHLNAELEVRIREAVQVVLRHCVKKFFRPEKCIATLMTQIYHSCPPQSESECGLLIYTLTQEVLLSTQNLKYRINDAINGLIQAMIALYDAPFRDSRWRWSRTAVLDCMMEIFESFSLAENTLRSFAHGYHQQVEQAVHERYQEVSQNLDALFSA